jgi:hypothetical protein
MAATRLSDSQKTELVARFREGSTAQDLAVAFGCSANTVSRVVRSALGDEEYERLKRRRTRRRSEAAAPVIAATEPELLPQPAPPPQPETPPESETPPGPVAAPAAADTALEISGADEEEEDGPGVLAIEDADDFGAEDDDDDELLADDDEDGVDEGVSNPFQPIPVALLDEADGPGIERSLRTLEVSSLPASAYMLVDKTVELQARPLSEFPELGRLPADELERQALVVFLNPRQAKRQCGRSQRVIKVPDLKVLELTAPYLLAQGISRVVIEGALYALPGS